MFLKHIAKICESSGTAVVVNHGINRFAVAHKDKQLFCPCNRGIEQVAVAKTGIYLHKGNYDCFNLVALAFVNGYGVCVVKFACIVIRIIRHTVVKANSHKAKHGVHFFDYSDIAVEYSPAHFSVVLFPDHIIVVPHLHDFVALAKKAAVLSIFLFVL